MRYSKSALVKLYYLILLHLVRKPHDFLQHQVSFAQVLHHDHTNVRLTLQTWFLIFQSQLFSRKLFTVFFSKSMFLFLVVFVDDDISGLPVVSTPVRAGRPMPRFASPSEQIGTSSAVSDRYYFRWKNCQLLKASWRSFQDAMCSLAEGFYNL